MPNYHNGTMNGSWPEHGWAEAQVLQMQSDERAMRVERFAEPLSDEWHAEAERLNQIALEAHNEKRAVGEMMRRLITCRDCFNPHFDSAVMLENAQIVGMCEWLLRTLRPRFALAKENHKVATIAWRNFVMKKREIQK